MHPSNYPLVRELLWVQYARNGTPYPLVRELLRVQYARNEGQGVGSLHSPNSSRLAFSGKIFLLGKGPYSLAKLAFSILRGMPRMQYSP